MGYLNPGTFSKHGQFGQDWISKTLWHHQMYQWTFWAGPNVHESFPNFRNGRELVMKLLSHGIVVWVKWNEMMFVKYSLSRYATIITVINLKCILINANNNNTNDAWHQDISLPSTSPLGHQVLRNFLWAWFQLSPKVQTNLDAQGSRLSITFQTVNYLDSQETVHDVKRFHSASKARCEIFFLFH